MNEMRDPTFVCAILFVAVSVTYSTASAPYSTYRNAVIGEAASSVIAHWPLDDLITHEHNATDIISGMDGRLNGLGIGDWLVGLQDGDAISGFSMGKSTLSESGSILLPRDPFFAAWTQQSWMLDFWVRLENFPAVLVEVENCPSTDLFRIVVAADGTIATTFNGVTAGSAPDQLSLGNWAYISVGIEDSNGSDLVTHVNGELASSSHYPGILVTEHCDVLFGKSSPVDTIFDEIVLHEGHETQSYLRRLYNVGIQRACRAGPCFSGVQCTASGTESYTCGSCPTGYTGDGEVCAISAGEKARSRLGGCIPSPADLDDVTYCERSCNGRRRCFMCGMYYSGPNMWAVRQACYIPSPTPSSTVSPTVTASSSFSSTETASFTGTASFSSTVTGSPSYTPTHTSSASVSPSVTATLSQTPSPSGVADADADGISDPVDNCIDAWNPSQLDSDSDGIGDHCDDVHDFAATTADLVLTVPNTYADPLEPHEASANTFISLKGILRNANCNAGYDITWDANLNDNLTDDSDTHFVVSNSYDIGRTFFTPNVSGEWPEYQDFHILVGAVNRCTSTMTYGVYHLRVYAWTPPGDPREWSNDQVDMLGRMSHDDGMWYIHRTIQRSVGSGGIIEATDSRGGNVFYELAHVTYYARTYRHLPSYPPGTITTAVPDGWHESNDYRWNVDPYAETLIRLLNKAFSDMRTTAIPGGADEAGTCGFNEVFVELMCDRIAGTTDAQGVYLNTLSTLPGEIGGGYEWEGLALSLPAIAGIPILSGQLQGKTPEYVLQQAVDMITYAQIDGGCAKGGYQYGPFHGSGGCSDTRGWAFNGRLREALVAEVMGGPYGVVVNNRLKYRIGDNAVRIQRGDGGVGWSGATPVGSNRFTPMAIGIMRWLHIHEFDRNSGLDIFRAYGDFTEGRMKQAYDTYVQFVRNLYYSVYHVDTYWGDTFFDDGDPLCDDVKNAFNAPACLDVGIAGAAAWGFSCANFTDSAFNWRRDFRIAALRSMERLGDVNNGQQSYGTFGRMIQTYCINSRAACRYAPEIHALLRSGEILIDYDPLENPYL